MENLILSNDKSATKTDNSIPVVLVTGATGFMGENLCRKLLSQNVIVYVVIRDIESFAVDLKANRNLISIIIHGNWYEKISKIEFDTIYHLASWSGLKHVCGDVDNIIDANIRLGTRLLELSAKQKIKKPNWVYCLSYWQYASGKQVYEPNSLYAASKQAFHSLVRYYAYNEGIKSVGVVMYDTYSVSDTRPKLLNIIEKNVSQHCHTGDNTLLALTPGEQEIFFCHIDDAVDALIKSAHELQLTKQLQSVYFARNSRVRTLKATVNDLLQPLCDPLKIIQWGAKPYPQGQVMKIVTGPKIPGWNAKRDLSETFVEMINSHHMEKVRDDI